MSSRARQAQAERPPGSVAQEEAYHDPEKTFPAAGTRKEASAQAKSDKIMPINGTAHRRNTVALPHVRARGVGGVARGHADDADLRRGHAPALAARPARHQGSRGHLSGAVAAALALRGGDAAAVPRAGTLPRHRGRQDAVHHRRRRLGGGGQIHHRARAASLAGALAERAEGRPHHHRRLPLSERDPRARRPDGEEGLSGKLRPAGAVTLSHRREGRPQTCACAGLFASDLRRDAEPVDRGRPARHPSSRA